MTGNGLAGTVEALGALAKLRVELQRRQEEQNRDKRVERGRVDVRWWLRYYLSDMFPYDFAVHHEIIIEDFVKMITRGDVLPLDALEQLQEPSDVLQEDEEPEPELLSDDEYDSLVKSDESEQIEVAQAAAYACPREHGKSTLMVGLVLWAIVYRLVRYPIFVADTATQAMDRLSEVVHELEGNPRIIEDFGNLKGDRRWSTWDVVTATGIRMRAYGTGSKLRGAKHGAARPDLAVVDDAENDEAVMTELQRRKLRDWITKVLLNALDSDRGVVVVIGTVLHHDSLLARLISQEHFPGWIKHRFKALIPQEDGSQKSLWPEHWPISKLLKKKKQIGSMSFASEFQNEPVDDETSPFQLEWLNKARAAGHGLSFVSGWEDVVRMMGGKEPLIVVSGWDFGWVDNRTKANATDSNYTCGISLAVHPVNRHRYLLRMFHDRGMTPEAVRNAVRREAAAIRPGALSATRFGVGVESVGLQKQLYAVGLAQATDLPIKPIFTDAGKHDLYTGVPGLSSLFEAEQIVLPWPDDVHPDARRQRALIQCLVNELHGLGREAHDDTVMALWFAETLIRIFLEKLDRRAGMAFVGDDRSEAMMRRALHADEEPRKIVEATQAEKDALVAQMLWGSIQVPDEDPFSF